MPVPLPLVAIARASGSRQRDLPIWRRLNGDLHLSQVLHLLLKAGELVL